eukprot:TRINITY_DN95408_c0_g1_i1.p1 TRINITY_DN95408_c0_g1~~TRINITY_DN95408_c0_g1_i1.p1  ORF type:complete len:657 (+),score=118.65 TRINITY_DN95408_c0_g1_i1:91-2061(+)
MYDESEKCDHVPGVVGEGPSSSSTETTGDNDQEARTCNDSDSSSSSSSDGASSDELGDAPRRNLRRTMTGLSTYSSQVKRSSTGTVFDDIDIEDVKHQLSAPIAVFGEEDVYRSSGLAQRIARSHYFQSGALAAIVIYTGWIGIDTDYNEALTLNEAPVVFIIVENLFCTIFTLEIAIRFWAYGSKLAAFRDAWFVFDFVLVVLMTAETWLLSIVLAFVEDPGSQAGSFDLGGTNYALRIMRLLRLTRLIRTVRLLRMMPELLIMVKGMLAAARSVFMTFAMTLLIVYVFGIAMKQATKGTEAGELYFSSVGHSMASLLLHATLLDGPSLILAQLNTFASVIFCLVVGISSLLLLNMLIGVLCEVVNDVSETETAMMDEASMRETLQHIMEKIDADGNQSISRHELEEMLKNEEATNLLKQASVDLMGLLDMSDMIFQSDSAGEAYEKELSIDEFMKVIMPLRTTNKASVKDVLALRKFVNDSNTKTMGSIDRVEDRLRYLETRLRNLSHALEHVFPQMANAAPAQVSPVRKSTVSTAARVNFTFDKVPSGDADCMVGIGRPEDVASSAPLTKAKAVVRQGTEVVEERAGGGKRDVTLEDLHSQLAMLLQQHALSSKYQEQAQQQHAAVTAQLTALQAGLLQVSAAGLPFSRDALS